MKAIVVYESLWGNTAAVARAIAEGIGQGARALATDEATPADVTEADLVVAGAPVMGFQLPTEGMREQVRRGASREARPPDLAHPTLRSWLERLPAGRGRSAAFETRFRWSPGGATGAIDKSLARAGYRPLTPPAKFIVRGKYGPLREGEIERARAWGATLAQCLARGVEPVRPS